ncbi:MAG: STAUR_1299 family protein [Acidobacteriota bacterium]
MADFRELILAKVFNVIPGMAYNQTRQDYYDQGLSLVYEIVLPAEGSWEQFRDKTYPTFVKYMKIKSIDPDNPHGVIVGVFFKDQCHFIDGQDFLMVLAEMEGLNSTTLQLRLKHWLRS